MCLALAQDKTASDYEYLFCSRRLTLTISICEGRTYSLRLAYMKIKESINLLNDMSFDKALEYFVQNATKTSGKSFVVSINPEIIMLARGDKDFEQALKSADLALNDGIGVSFGAKMFGKHLSGRVSGVDLVDSLCRVIAKKPITVGFLGGKGNVAKRTAERLTENYPGLNVAFSLEEWPSFEAKNLKADILFVAFGSPKQEKWIFEHLDNLDVKVAMGVGGTFDFISGNVRRAPEWMRRVGLEWLFRLIIQPWRLKRQTSLIKFFFLVIGEKTGIV